MYSSESKVLKALTPIHFFGSAIYTNPNLFNLFDAEFTPLVYKTLPVHLSMLGGALLRLLFCCMTRQSYTHLYSTSYVNTLFP